MLNRNPIIVNGFGRGGTNILMNLLLSHPGTAMPTGELNKVFKGGGMGEGRVYRLFKKFIYDTPIRLLSGEDLFDRFWLSPRKIPPRIILRYIDRVLYWEKKRARHESHNLWKKPGHPYSRNELAEARLTVKAHNGLIYLNDLFREIYPDVRFVCIIRNGISVVEGQMRRGIALEKAAELYRKVVEEMIRNSESEDYLIVKFEGLIEHPLEVLQRIYTHCELDPDECEYFRLQHKAVIDKTGKAILKGKYDRQLVWYEKKNLGQHFNPQVNRNQLKRLSRDDLDRISELMGDALRYFGYSIPTEQPA